MRRVLPLPEDGDDQPVSPPATPQPAFLPGMPHQQTDPDLDLERQESPAAGFITMRGVVLATDPPANQTSVSHPTTGDSPGRQLPTSMVLPRRSFQLRGELMHCFVSYRVNTEGSLGNGLSGLLAEKIRALSMDKGQDLHIPRHGNPVSSLSMSHPSPTSLLSPSFSSAK